MRVKMSKPPPPAPTASAIGPCPTVIQVVGRPRHWKFTQHHRNTRPSPPTFEPSSQPGFEILSKLQIGEDQKKDPVLGKLISLIKKVIS